MAGENTINLLFVCSMNQWRSPTAEKIYQQQALLHARSRGTSRNAVRSVTAVDIKWADIVFAMEDKHARRLQSEFSGEMRFKEMYVLDIPDEYRFMDPELVNEIRSAVDPILARS